MSASIDIEIGGQKKTLLFNNFAHTELSKILFDSGHLVSSPSEVLDTLLNMANTNTMLLMKALVYAGIVGHDYETGFKVSMTQAEVGKLVGQMNDTDLLAIWDVFHKAMGVDVSKVMQEDSEEENQDESQENSEKKK